MTNFSAFVGMEVEKVQVWYSLRLVFASWAADDPGAYIDVTQFDFIEPDSTIHSIDVEKAPVDAGIVLSVLHTRVTEAAAVNWELRLAFESGARLVCPPHPKYEAWQAQLPGEPSAIYAGGPGDADGSF